MKSSRLFVLLGMLFVIAVTTAQVSCNPESAALDLFSRQGLNLLRPARDYIQPGGMVFVPNKGLPVYEEPRDRDVVPEEGNLTDFRAEILAETRNQRTGLGGALSLATSVIPVPISAGAQGNKLVSLKQVDTTGVRLKTDALDNLIGAPETAKAAKAELGRGTRVFIVQEVYRTSTMELGAEDGKSFELHLNDGAAVADCKQEKAAKDSKQDKSEANAPDKKSPPAGSAKNNLSGEGAKQAAGKGGDTAGKGKNPISAVTANVPKLGAGVAVCVANSYTLKLQSDSPIPFAVRLAELQLSADGSVQRNRGKVIKIALGEEEISGAVISEKVPVLEDLTRRNIAQK